MMNFHRTIALLGATLLTACATLPPDDPADPFEPVNRAMFSFNRTADHYVLKPVAEGYKAVVPNVAQKAVVNFFGNLAEPVTIVNGVLQGKFLQATSDTGRFLMNSTIGLAGLVDVASKSGMPRHDEDFGQTLGYWGLGTGAYLMLPLLGPSNGRDIIGRGADYFTNPLYYIQQNNSDEDYIFYGSTVLSLVSLRTQLLGADALVDGAIDPYIFIRTAYLQNRLNKVYDGSPPRALLYGEEDDE